MCSVRVLLKGLSCNVIVKCLGRACNANRLDEFFMPSLNKHVKLLALSRFDLLHKVSMIFEGRKG